jgi:hypothetical protein
MILLFYSTISEECAEKIEGLIAKAIPTERIEIHRSIESLAQKIRHPEEERMILLLALHRREDLEEILGLRTILENMRTILVLPDQKEETIAAAHQLRPRFLTVLNGDMEELAAVTKKMAMT